MADQELPVGFADGLDDARWWAEWIHAAVHRRADEFARHLIEEGEDIGANLVAEISKILVDLVRRLAGQLLCGEEGPDADDREPLTCNSNKKETREKDM